MNIILITLNICQKSLPDAEILKDIPEDFVGGDFADDGTDVVDCFADVLRGEVGRETGGQAFADAKEGSACVGECLDVALVCDEGSVAVAKKVTLSRGQELAQTTDPGSGFSGYRQYDYRAFVAVFARVKL